MSDYILKAAATDRDLWFKQMTGIGPMTTADLSEAERFGSEEEARQHPANRHMLAIFDPVELDSTPGNPRNRKDEADG